MIDLEWVGWEKVKSNPNGSNEFVDYLISYHNNEKPEILSLLETSYREQRNPSIRGLIKQIIGMFQKHAS